MKEKDIGIEAGDMNGVWRASEEFLEKMRKIYKNKREYDQFSRREASPKQIEDVRKGAQNT